MRVSLSVLEDNVGKLSKESKMPWLAYGTPASACKTGSKLRQVPGSVCYKCYALKGRYGFGATQRALQRRMDKLMSNPDKWTKDMISVLRRKAERTPAEQRYFRWHPSGDLQGEWHLEKIIEIAVAVPEVQFWIPTREYGMVQAVLERVSRPVNLTIRLSAHMIDGPSPIKLARKLGVVVSGVSSDKTAATCPAPQQNGECADCRNCWNNNKMEVVYAKH